MRVLLLASTFPRRPGDPQPTFILDLARELAAGGTSVEALVPGDPAAAAEETIDGVSVRRFRYAPLRRWERLAYGSGMLANVRTYPWLWLVLPLYLLAMILQVLRRCRRGDIDIVHAHWIVPQGVCAAAALALLPAARRPALVITGHGADVYAFGGFTGRLLKRYALRRADLRLAVSGALARDMTACAGDGRPVQVAPMGIRLPAPEAHSAANRAGPAAGKAPFCFVGRFVEKKGVDDLLAAWARARTLSSAPLPGLVIAGDGPLRARLEARARELGIDREVTFAGWLGRDAVDALMRSSLALLMPSKTAADGDREGLGLVAVEALVAGTPVIACDFAAAADIAAVSPALIRVPAGNIEALARAIVSAAETGLPAVDTAAVAAAFGWPATGDRHRALYAQAISVRRR